MAGGMNIHNLIIDNLSPQLQRLFITVKWPAHFLESVKKKAQRRLLILTLAWSPWTCVRAETGSPWLPVVKIKILFREVYGLSNIMNKARGLLNSQVLTRY